MWVTCVRTAYPSSPLLTHSGLYTCDTGAPTRAPLTADLPRAMIIVRTCIVLGSSVVGLYRRVSSIVCVTDLASIVACAWIGGVDVPALGIQNVIGLPPSSVPPSAGVSFRKKPQCF